MDEFLFWVANAISDFRSLSPTAQITFASTALGFAGALLVGFWKLFIKKRRTAVTTPDTQPTSEIERIVKLVESGNATAREAAELARALYGAADQTNDRPDAAGADSGHGTDQQTYSKITGRDEERRAFTNVVAELATSDDSFDRDIVLQYARGNHDAAISTLESRAQAAAENGAPIWREIAALARPVNQAKAILALREAINLDPADVLSICRLSKALLTIDKPTEALETAQSAVNASPDQATKARALVRLCAAQRAVGETFQASETANRAVEAAKNAATEDPSDVERARMLANAFEQKCAVQITRGQLVEACETVEKSIRIFEHLHEDDPSDEDTLLDLTRARFSRAHLEKVMGDITASANTLKEASSFAAQAAKDNPGNLWLANADAEAVLRYGFAVDTLGLDEDALAYGEKAELCAANICSRDPDYAEARQNLIWAKVLQVRMLAQLNRIEDARERSHDMVEVARRGADSQSDAAKYMLSVALHEQGNLNLALGDLLGAEEDFTEASQIVEQIADADPTNVSKRDDAIIASWKIGEVAVAKSDFSAYSDIVKENVQACQAQVDQNPGSWSAKNALAYAFAAAGHASSLMENHEESVDFGQMALDVYSKLAALDPDSLDAKHSEIDTRRLQSAFLKNVNRTNEALELAEQAQHEIEALNEKTPNSTKFTGALHKSRLNLSDLLSATGSLQRALDLRRENCELLRSLHEAAPLVKSHRRDLLHSHLRYGELLRSAGKNQAALEQIECAEALMDRQSNNPTRDDLETILVVKDRKSGLLAAMGRVSESKQLEEECFRLSIEYANNPSDLNAQKNLVVAYLNKVDNEFEQNQWDAAEELLGKAVETSQKLSDNKAYIREIEQSFIEKQFSIATARADSDLQSKLIAKRVEYAREEVSKNPVNLTNRLRLSDLLARQNNLERRLEKGPRQFDPIIAEAISIDKDFPDEPRVARSNFETWYRVASAMQADGWYTEALVSADRAMQCQRTVKSETETAPWSHRATATLHLLMARCHYGLDRLSHAVQELEATKEHLIAFKAEPELEKHVRPIQLDIFDIQCEILNTQGKVAQSAEILTEFETKALEHTAKEPSNAGAWISLASVYYFAFSHLQYTDRLAEAAPSVKKIEDAVSRFSELTEDAEAKEYVDVFTRLAHIRILIYENQFDRAKDAAHKNKTVITARLDRRVSTHSLRNLASTHDDLGEIALLTDDRQAAIAEYNNALAAIDRAKGYTPDVAALDHQKLKCLYFRAQATQSPQDFETVKSHLAWMQERSRSMGPDRWIIDLLSDERVAGA